jgi:prevent-host-death family protein
MECKGDHPGGLMLVLGKVIQCLSHFKRNTAELVKRMKESGNPVVLTVNGKAEVVVQDSAAYQRLRELAERAEMLQFLQEAKADADAGRTVPARKLLESLGKMKRVRKT